MFFFAGSKKKDESERGASTIVVPQHINVDLVFLFRFFFSISLFILLLWGSLLFDIPSCVVCVCYVSCVVCMLCVLSQ